MDTKKKTSQAQRKAIDKYLSKKERIYVVFEVGTKDRIHDWIYQNGYYDHKYIGEFIRDAVNEKLNTKI